MTFWDEEFSEKLQDLVAMLEKTEKAVGVAKSQELQECQRKLKQVESEVRRGFCMEMRQQPPQIKYSFQQVLYLF